MESDNNQSSVVTDDAQPQTERAADSANGSTTEAFAGAAADSGEVERLQKEKNELQDLLQRRQAEFDNYRRRVERERGELYEMITMDRVKDLLPILDDFDRAIKVENVGVEYSRGMELIHQRFYELLKKLGLDSISTEGSSFDPHTHHAVKMEDTKDHPDQTILEEYQRGYNFKGRLLRPAMVKVAVNP